VVKKGWSAALDIRIVVFGVAEGPRKVRTGAAVGCRHVLLGSSRLATAIMAGSLALAACTSTGDADPVDELPEASPPATNEDNSVDPVKEPDDPVEQTDDEAVAAAYEAFLDGLTAPEPLRQRTHRPRRPGSDPQPDSAGDGGAAPPPREAERASRATRTQG
jgi:hypothetical protein